MKRSRASIRAAALVAFVALLALLLAQPIGARSSVAYQLTVEPSPRPTATPAPYLELDPTQGVAGNPTQVAATGGLWAAGHTVRLYWDDTTVFLGETQILGNGTFQLTFVTPTDPVHATVGMHRVLAIATNGDQAEATFELITATPTATNTATLSPTPSNTPSITPTRTPVTPSSTPTASVTPTPSPTLKPITPMASITPIPPTGQPPRPTSTRGPTAVPGTATRTRTPSPTPGPGTPSATPLPTSTASPTPEGEIADTGGGWGSLFLWGFVLAGLVVAFRLLRVRGLGEPR